MKWRFQPQADKYFRFSHVHAYAPPHRSRIRAHAVNRSLRSRTAERDIRLIRTTSLGSRNGIGRSNVPVRCLTESLLGSRFVTYKINAMGQRVQKIGAGLYAPSTTATINATTGQSPQGISLNFNARFVYDEQGRIIGEYANDGKLIAETIWFNDLPIATLRPKGSNNQIPLGTPGTTATQANNVGNNTTANKVNVDIYYVHPDHLGTPRAVTRSAAIGSATTGPNAINKCGERIRIRLVARSETQRPMRIRSW
jgi:hypothetical protein